MCRVMPEGLCANLGRALAANNGAKAKSGTGEKNEVYGEACFFLSLCIIASNI